MAEQNTPVMDPAPIHTPAPQPSGKAPERKKKNRKIVKNIITAIIVLAVIAAAGWALWYFVFTDHKDSNLGQPIYDTAMTGTISTTVRGGGAANAKDSATITLAADGVVQEVYVTQGQVVNAGDPLYVVTSPAAEEALKTAQEALVAQQEAMSKLNEEMADLQKSRNDLTITAPHGGKLTEVSDVKVGDPMTSGTQIAVLVDDTKLKLSLYYSYAYENDISVGQTAEISIPATMTTRTGTVEKINKVERIVPEGSVTFEVIFVLDNPGTLTADMVASASLTDSAGNPIYPYESGKLAYYQTTTIATKASGPVEQVADLMNYANVTAGQVLLVQGTNDIDEQIRAKQEQINTAQESLTKAQQAVADAEKNVQNFSAVAPISGTVVTCSLVPDMEVTAGTAAIVIADNAVMTVNIQVDDRNRQYISEGMTINLSDWNGNSYMGVVETVAVQGTNENGVTVFPATIRVDNPTGTLMGGYYLDYEFTAAESTGIIIPSQDVRYYTPEGAEAPQPVVYLQLQPGQEAPETAIDKSTLPAEMQEEIPEDCVVVPVETGLNDDMNVEITSGLNEGDLVYNNTPSEDGSYYGRKASASSKAD